MRRNAVAAMALSVMTVAACGDEGPTEVGGGLIGPGVVTFETVLEAERFLVQDTTYDELGTLSSAAFTLVAREFEGGLNAHGLLRLTLPERVTWQDTAGVTHDDTITAFRGAELTLVVDTLSGGGGPVQLEVLPLLEEWDAPTVTWTLRSDTAGMPEPWSEPGGTTGSVVGQATWTAGTDTLVIPFDSADAAVWTDSLGALRGGLIRAATTGARLRINALQFRFLVEPESSTDTVVPAGSLSRSRFIRDAEAPPPGPSALRVGGLPTWRSLLRFQRLDTLTLTVDEIPGCPGVARDVPFDAATLNLATLLLAPVPGGPHRIETPAVFVARTVLEAPTVPLARSPLSSSQGFTEQAVPVDRFSSAPADPAPVGMPITPFVRRLQDPDPAADTLDWLALTASVEGSTFGYGEFGGVGSATPPRLRLLLSVPASELGGCID